MKKFLKNKSGKINAICKDAARLAEKMFEIWNLKFDVRLKRLTSNF
jgi:hypothetical protein